MPSLFCSLTVAIHRKCYLGNIYRETRYTIIYRHAHIVVRCSALQYICAGQVVRTYSSQYPVIS